MGTSGSARDSKDGARVLLDVGSCLALSLFWVWNWTTFQSPTSLPLEFFDGAVTLPTRFVSLMAFAVTGFVLFACFQARPEAGKPPFSTR